MSLFFRSIGLIALLIVVSVQMNLIQVDTDSALKPFNNTVKGITGDRSTQLTDKAKLRAVKKHNAKYWKIMLAGDYKRACSMMTDVAVKQVITGQRTVIGTQGDGGIAGLKNKVTGQVNSHNDPERRAGQKPPSCEEALADLRFPRAKIKLIDVKSISVNGKVYTAISGLHYKKSGTMRTYDVAIEMKRDGKKLQVSSAPASQ